MNIPTLKNLEEIIKFYEERYASKYEHPQGYAYVICLKENNFPIGYVNVSMEENHDFGYGLRKEFWHKGIVTEVGKAVIEQVREDGLPYITATHDRNNPRSGNVMQKVGMTYCYSYEEQWQPNICLILYGIQAAAPTISAIIVLCLDKKVKSCFAQMFRKEHLKMAIILPFIIAGMTMILAKIIFCALSGKAFMLGNISSVQFVIILWALLAEEIGWRGYLEPWLEAYGLHRRIVPCIVGAVWCLWHYHFFYGMAYKCQCRYFCLPSMGVF